MTLRRDSHPFPPFPTIRTARPLTGEEERAVRELTALAGRHGPFNLFTVPGVLDKWGNKKRGRAASILVSDAALEGVAPETSFAPTLGKHIALEDERGDAYGHAACAPAEVKTRDLILLADHHGRGWAYDPATGEAEPASLETAPVILAFITGGRRLAELLPLRGRLSLIWQMIDGADGPLITPDAALLDQAERVVAALVRREEDIRRAAEPAFSDERLSAVLDTLTLPAVDEFIPPHHHPERRAFDDAVHEIALDALRGLRDAGLCAPCPNNGPRGVRALEAWDAFMNEGADADEREGHAGWKRWAIKEAPALRAVYSALILSVSEHRKNLREGGAPLLMDRERAEAAMRLFRERALLSLAAEESDIGLGAQLSGALESAPYELAGSFLKPVLADPMSKAPLPIIEAPRAVRHMVLELPTGRLTMADWFRIPGFSSAMENLSDENETGFDINYAEGLDARARAYFTRAGVAIVQVGNSSPSAYADTPGVWRMGRVDEDHEDLPDDEAPGAAWDTCTDLWANTFASPEAIIAVLMASGEHDSEEAAERALTAYCDETYGAHIIDLGVDRLHLYLPTGYAERLREPMRGVGAGVISQDEWREDAYLLSAFPLPVEPGVLEDEEWEAPAVGVRGFEGPEVG